MAIALVAAGTVNSGTTSASPTFGATTTAGNLLICLAASAAGTGPITVSGTGWQVAIAPNAVDEVAIFYKENCGAGETAPTITGPTGTTATYAMLVEFSGCVTSSSLDRANSSSFGTASPVTGTMSGVDAASGELLVTADGIILSKAGTDTTADSYNNATVVPLADNDASSVAAHYRFAYGITTSNSSADSNTLSDTSMNLTGLATALASFKAAPPTATITTVTPNSGYWSDLGINIIGSGFTNTTSVDFGGVAAVYSLYTAALIRANVPVGASTGPIHVVTSDLGTATSPSNFTILQRPPALAFA